jgi:tetratricopeptide (TPR) repeat protein
MTKLTIRPQPLGIFPLPAAYLVLPPADGATELQAALLRGHVPDSTPAALRFYPMAVAGDLAGALSALADDDTPEARYNRFVLRSDPAAYPALRQELNGDLALLLELVAYTMGWSDAPPDLGDTSAELRAGILSAQAAHAIEAGDLAKAEAMLVAAVDAARPTAPLLAAQLLGDLADMYVQRSGPGPAALHALNQAITLLEDSGLHEARAQLQLKLGMLYQELARGQQRGALLEAVRWYQEALRVFTREKYPELYALAQNNLALAYLAMPLTEASDQLRMAIAVQALREALKVYEPESYPERWASAQLNLANALQYLPSSHPQDNLAEAVELYEQLLQTRDPASNPAGYARLLANQGNALAHLGIFKHARPKLQEAGRLFTIGGDNEAVAAVYELLAAIAAHTTEQPRQEQDGSIPTPTV